MSDQHSRDIAAALGSASAEIKGMVVRVLCLLKML
jgi:hypothetical protein